MLTPQFWLARKISVLLLILSLLCSVSLLLSLETHKMNSKHLLKLISGHTKASVSSLIQLHPCLLLMVFFFSWVLNDLYLVQFYLGKLILPSFSLEFHIILQALLVFSFLCLDMVLSKVTTKIFYSNLNW